MKYYIGVEIGSKVTQVGAIDKFGRLIARRKASTQTGHGLEVMVQDAVKLIENLLEAEDLDIKSVKYIGIGCPGIPDKKSENIMKNDVMGFYDAPIKQEFQKYFKMPIYIQNDANCAALAESYIGAAEDLDYSVTINIGTGISCGIIIENKIYDGFEYTGGVISHMSIDKNGPVCTCGRRGCFEVLCSETALIQSTRKAAEENPDSKIMQLCNGKLEEINELTAFEAAKQGDETANKVLNQYLDDFSEVLANIANVLMPQVIIFCGSIATRGEELLKPLRQKMKDKVYYKETFCPELMTAQLGSAAVLIGAALLGLDRSKL